MKRNDTYTIGAVSYTHLQFYLVEFPQRPGALRQFVNDVLGPNDDITRFEYGRL